MSAVLRLFKIEGNPVASGREGLAAKAAAELLRGGPVLGEYLKAFDVDAHEGRGDATFTKNVAKAMRFKDVAEALAAYQMQSKLRPMRRDGRPNRPLTAFNMTVETIPD